jgi:hypothetical protein
MSDSFSSTASTMTPLCDICQPYKFKTILEEIGLWRHQSAKRRLVNLTSSEPLSLGLEGPSIPKLYFKHADIYLLLHDEPLLLLSKQPDFVAHLTG